MLLFIVCLIVCCKNPAPQKPKKLPEHFCKFIACDLVGFDSLPEEYNPIDSIHFFNPSLTYDSCEAIVLKNNL